MVTAVYLVTLAIAGNLVTQVNQAIVVFQVTQVYQAPPQLLVILVIAVILV